MDSGGQRSHPEGGGEAEDPSSLTRVRPFFAETRPRPAPWSREGPFLAVAVDAVLRAGDVDLKVESMFRDMIAERFPEHGVLAEEMAESLLSEGAVRSRWLFDPLDGTSNYAHGIPFYCAALALEVNTVVETAAVFDPTRGELFTAERGRGAWLNGEPVGVSKTADLSGAMLGTGFPHGLSMRDTSMEALLGEFATRGRAVRRLGSAVLDSAGALSSAKPGVA